jgi:hypothetical protein
VDDLASEALDALELRQVALVVAVVAAAEEEEAAGHLHALAVVAALDVDVPERLVRRPLGRHDAVAEADPLVDPVLARGVAHVLADRGAVRDRLRVRPRAEPEAERVHVRVRPDPRIAEQVPRPADRVARLEDRVALVRTLVLKVEAGADPGDTCADDEDVEVLGRHGGPGDYASPARAAWEPSYSRASGGSPPMSRPRTSLPCLQ